MPAISKLCVAAVAVGMLLSAGLCAAQDAPEQKITFETKELFAQNGYRFVIEQKFSQFPEDTDPLDMEQTLIVTHKGGEPTRYEGWRWEIYSAEGFSEPRPFSPASGSDITGDGVPDLVLMEYSGGAHCCSTYYLFELGATPRVQELGTGDSPIWFKQLDDKPGLEIRLYDTSFAYWRSSFAGSAAPAVILRYRDGAYEPASDLMRAPAPSAAMMAEWVKEANEADGWEMETKPRGSSNVQDLGGAFLKRVTQLVYEGHADLVRGFVELAWPAAKPGKDDFIAELMECRIRRSTYWPAVAEMNSLPADKPIGKCS